MRLTHCEFSAWVAYENGRVNQAGSFIIQAAAAADELLTVKIARKLMLNILPLQARQCAGIRFRCSNGMASGYSSP